MTKTAAVAFEVRWRKNSDPSDLWSTPVPLGADGHVSVPGLERVTDYTFQARAISGCGAKSAWATQTFTLPDVGAGTLTLAGIQSQAAQAQTDANAANAELANIASDNVLSSAEKPTVMRDYSVITTEQAGIDAQATQYGITTQKSDYDNAISTLTAYLNTLNTPTAWNNKSGDTDIVGSTFRTYFNNVYTTRQALLNAIYAQAQALANNAQGTANSIASGKIPLVQAGRNAIFNPNFTQNNGSFPNGGIAQYGYIRDGWQLNATTDAVHINALYDTNALAVGFIFGSGVTVPANGVSQASWLSNKFAVNAGAPFVVSATRSNYLAQALPAGLAVGNGIGIDWYNAAGQWLSNTWLAEFDGAGNTAGVVGSGTVPAGAALADIVLLGKLMNSTGSAIVTTNSNTAEPLWSAVEFIQTANLDTDVYDGGTFGRVNNTNLTGNNVDLAKTGVQGRHLDNIGDGPSQTRNAIDYHDVYYTGGVNRVGLRIPGSTHRLGDQGNAPASLTSSLGMVRSATALTAFSTGAVNVNAHTVTYGPRVVSYNAVTNAVTGLAQGSGYYIYCRDNGAGGSPTWNATTNAQVANGFDDGYNAGYVTIPTSGSSGGGGSGGPGPGGGCVCADMALWPLFMGWRSALTAGDLARRWRWWKPWLWFLRGPDGWHLIRRRPRIVHEYCVRPIVADGSHVDCSVHTPVTTHAGESILAPHLFGHGMATCSGWQRVTDVIALPDLRDVVRICVGGNSFFASADGWRFISTHNVWKQ